MRRYECFRRRERFLGVLVFAKLIRISIADILVVSVITRARCKTEPKAPPVDEISNLPVHLGSLLPLNGSVPSLLLSINIADWHTSKQANGRLHTSCIFCSKKKGTLSDASFIRPNTANGIQRMFFRRLGRGISSCARTSQSRNSLPPSSFCPFSHQLSIVSPI